VCESFPHKIFLKQEFSLSANCAKMPVTVDGADIEVRIRVGLSFILCLGPFGVECACQYLCKGSSFDSDQSGQA
jgi:hypothetical protein